MRLGQFLAHSHEFGRDHSQSAPFEAGDHFADQRALHAIGFNTHQRSFHRDSSRIKFVGRNGIPPYGLA
jgi:hypothetical protein